MLRYGLLLLRDHIRRGRARVWLVLTGRGVSSALFGNLRRRMKRRTKFVKAFLHHFGTRWNRCLILAGPVLEVWTVRVMLRGHIVSTLF